MNRLLNVLTRAGLCLALVCALTGCDDSGGEAATDQPAATLTELSAMLISPVDVCDWMAANLTYGWPGYPSMDAWRYLSPQQVFDLRQGDCTSQSAFAAYILNQHGCDCHLLWIHRNYQSCHAVCYWLSTNGSYYAIDDSHLIYGPFATVADVGRNAYDRIVAGDGQAVGYSLWMYDGVAYGLTFSDFLNARTPL